MTEEVSKTQIDRIGDRLKKGNIAEGDLRLLDRYRLSFTKAHEVVVGRIRKHLGLEPTVRPAKSTSSISEKLRRETIRLTQIQDIAGCRLIVADIVEQNRVVESLLKLFPGSIIVDRRETPSHGYRAVHVIANYDKKLVEIQVRTSLQHFWAEISEKLGDIIDPAIKYGGGGESRPRYLDTAAEFFAAFEIMELAMLPLLDREETGDSVASKRELRNELHRRKLEMLDVLRKGFEDMKG